MKVALLILTIITIKITILLTVARAGYWYVAPIIAVIFLSMHAIRAHRV